MKQTLTGIISIVVVILFIFVPVFDVLAATVNDVNKQMRNAPGSLFQG